MRKIKFRGKVKSDGLWEYGSLWIDKGKYYINGTDNEWWEVIPETVGQYTGLKDKNNVEIYEGGVIEIVNNLSEATKQNKHKTLVKFRDCAFVSAWQDLRFDGTYGEVYNHFGSYNTPIVTFEVIGNIHDNKELLEAVLSDD